jgi:hypothetical protein
MACCNDDACSSAASSDALNGPRWRRALWIALFINAGFFVTEIVAVPPLARRHSRPTLSISSVMLQTTPLVSA